MPGLNRITWHNLENDGLPKNVTAVINLAGQNVLDPSRRWTSGFKQNVWNSRINSSAAIVRAINSAEVKPKVFINISGVSLYRSGANKIYNELDQGESYDFMSKLCIEWEKSATLPTNSECRQVKIRTGVVLGRDGGMIKSLIVPFYMGVGGVVATGKQPLPWIHINDLCDLIRYTIEEDKVSGVLNGVAPDIITNEKFTKAFASALSRPAFFPLPHAIVNLIFGKERGVILTEGAKIEPKLTLASGFKYTYPDIMSACKEVGRLF